MIIFLNIWLLYLISVYFLPEYLKILMHCLQGSKTNIHNKILWQGQWKSAIKCLMRHLLQWVYVNIALIKMLQYKIVLKTLNFNVSCY